MKKQISNNKSNGDNKKEQNTKTITKQNKKMVYLHADLALTLTPTLTFTLALDLSLTLTLNLTLTLTLDLVTPHR